MGGGAIYGARRIASGADSISFAAVPIVAIAALLLTTPARADSALSPADLDRLPIEDLAKIEVSSVEKTAQPLSQAPGAIYVITHDDIMRSGATAMADILRLAPNLQVAQITASSDAISARGFNSAAADKLLVLVDGRSVYATFFSGVFWDALDVPPETIERIEVISGPGGTLWGANAVNGVINIITRKSSETQGGVLDLTAGTMSGDASLRYGGRIADDLSYRVYVDSADYASDVTATGANARDDWSRNQGGFRIDWTPSKDLITFQGDFYGGSEDELGRPAEAISGENLLGRWTHPIDGGGDLQIQAYYDGLERSVPGQVNDRVGTYDIEAQHSFSWGARQQIVWGAGLRLTRDDFAIVPANASSPLTQVFTPQSRTLVSGDLFGQDTIALTPALKLVVGLKLEDDPYSVTEPVPSVRLSWMMSDQTLLWAAVSRAIRAPSRLDRDFSESLGNTLYLTGGVFQSESLVAYELGARTQFSPRLSGSISAYYNDYDDLRSFELSPGGALPILIENDMYGQTYGVEAWGAYQVTSWWRLRAGANWLHKDLRYKPGTGLLGVEIAGDDPAYQASLSSTMNLGHDVMLDLDLRDVGALPAPPSPTYAELDLKLAWAVSDRVEIALIGANLLHERHLEFGSSAAPVQLGAIGVETPRSVALSTRLRF